MKKKKGILIAVLLTIVLLSASACFSFDFLESAHIAKAKAFIAAGMDAKAVALLEEEINGSDKHEANPTNAEAHFLLGKIYASQGDNPKAKERFQSAVKLDPEYGPKIGAVLRKIANNKMAEKNYVQASALYDGAAHYNSELNKEIAPRQFELGIIFAGQGDAINAERSFANASKADPSFDSRIPLEYKKAAGSLLSSGDVEKAIMLYENALRRDAGLKKEIAKELLDYGKEKNSEYVLSLAAKLNPELKKAVKENCWLRVEKLNGQELLNLTWNTKQCGELTEAQKETIGKKLLTEGNRQNSDNERERYYKDASIYVSQEILFDSTVEYYSQKLGTPHMAELNEVNNWKFVAHVNDGDIIHYLSLKSFIRKGEKNKTQWEPAISQKTHYTFYNNTDSDIWFGKNKENTKVYYWVEKK